MLQTSVYYGFPRINTSHNTTRSACRRLPVMSHSVAGHGVVVAAAGAPGANASELHLSQLYEVGSPVASNVCRTPPTRHKASERKNGCIGGEEHAKF
ncbi:hypothetical protein EVAR_34121_1 [Eumeta japonica]|uniref:Uncharacterized protein n=1 Tax=Eumeta variegata TaxID=151549 RepID=A0A4C1WMH5_EUMVA|nr:hypothetical protein EVAR_34121_1 [Eumeta japonica]